MTEKRKSGKNSLRLRLISSVMLNLLDISAPLSLAKNFDVKL